MAPVAPPPVPSPAGRAFRLLEGAALAAIALAGVLIALRKIESRDLPWHLATGREILETGAVPKVDRFTVLGYGRDWLDVHWLAQVGLALIERASGLCGIQLATALALVTSVLTSLAFARRAGSRGFELPLAVLALQVAWSRVEPRPDLFSLLLPSVELMVLESLRAAGTTRTRFSWMAVLLLVQTAWSNVHGSFVLGVVIAFTYALAAWVTGEDRASRRRASVAALGTLVVCSINPRGLRAYLLFPPYVRDMGSRLGLFVAEGTPNIQEWQPTFTPLGRQFLIGSFAPYVVLLVLALLSILAPRRVLPLRMAAVLVLFAALSATAIRNVAPFVFVALAMVPAGLEGWARLLAPRARAWLAWILPATALGTAAMFGLGLATNRYYASRHLVTETGVGWNPLCFPVTACDWLDAAGVDGQAFHNFEVGGYYLWRFDRKRRAFLDGRLDLLAPAEMERYSRAMAEPERLEAMLRDGGVTHVLLRYAALDARAALPYLEAQRSRWRRVFADGTAALYLRSDVVASPRGNPMPAEHPWDLRARRLLAAVARWQVHLPVALHNEAQLRQLSREWPAVRSLYERALVVDPSNQALHRGLASACGELGDLPCVARERAWLAEHPLP